MKFEILNYQVLQALTRAGLSSKEAEELALKLYKNNFLRHEIDKTGKDINYKKIEVTKMMESRKRSVEMALTDVQTGTILESTKLFFIDEFGLPNGQRWLDWVRDTFDIGEHHAQTLINVSHRYLTDEFVNHLPVSILKAMYHTKEKDKIVRQLLNQGRDFDLALIEDMYTVVDL